MPNRAPASNVSPEQSAALVAKTAVRDAALEYRSPEPAKELVSEDERKKIILSFLKMLSPVDKTPAAVYLARRRIYKPIWDKMLCRQNARGCIPCTSPHLQADLGQDAFAHDYGLWCAEQQAQGNL